MRFVQYPKYTETIPSTGETIEFRPFTAREMTTLLMAYSPGSTTEQLNAAMDDMIRACTNEKIGIKTHPIFDLQYLFLKIRCMSVSHETTVTVSCDQCGFKQEETLDLRNVEVKKLDSDELIDFGHLKVKMRYPTLAEADGLGSGVFEQTVDAIARCVTQIITDDEVIPWSEDVHPEIVQMIEMTEMANYIKLEKWLLDMPTVSYNFEFTCQDCNHAHAYLLQGVDNFF